MNCFKLDVATAGLFFRGKWFYLLVSCFIGRVMAPWWSVEELGVFQPLADVVSSCTEGSLGASFSVFKSLRADPCYEQIWFCGL